MTGLDIPRRQRRIEPVQFRREQPGLVEFHRRREFRDALAQEALPHEVRARTVLGTDLRRLREEVLSRAGGIPPRTGTQLVGDRTPLLILVGHTQMLRTKPSPRMHSGRKGPQNPPD